MVCNLARVSVSLRSNVGFCALHCPHFVIMFSNRHGSAPGYWQFVEEFLQPSVLALQQYSLRPTEAVLCLSFLALAIDAISFRCVDDTNRQTISILYERDTIDSSIEPCSTEDEFFCKRADFVLCCPNCQQSALLIASFRFQFSERVNMSVMKTATSSAALFCSC